STKQRLNRRLVGLAEPFGQLLLHRVRHLALVDQHVDGFANVAATAERMSHDRSRSMVAVQVIERAQRIELFPRLELFAGHVTLQLAHGLAEGECKHMPEPKL